MTEIIHDKESNKFILKLENNLIATVSYILTNSKSMNLIHSEVPYQLRGKGIGKKLVLKTFDKLTEEGYQANATCSYIRTIAKRSEKWIKIIG